MAEAKSDKVRVLREGLALGNRPLAKGDVLQAAAFGEGTVEQLVKAKRLEWVKEPASKAGEG